MMRWQGGLRLAAQSRRVRFFVYTARGLLIWISYIGMAMFLVPASTLREIAPTAVYDPCFIGYRPMQLYIPALIGLIFRSD
jgi:hypothetical protein